MRTLPPSRRIKFENSGSGERSLGQGAIAYLVCKELRAYASKPLTISPSLVFDRSSWTRSTPPLEQSWTRLHCGAVSLLELLVFTRPFGIEATGWPAGSPPLLFRKLSTQQIGFISFHACSPTRPFEIEHVSSATALSAPARTEATTTRLSRDTTCTSPCPPSLLAPCIPPHPKPGDKKTSHGGGRAARKDWERASTQGAGGE